MNYSPHKFSPADVSDDNEIKIFKINKPNKGLFKIDDKQKCILAILIILIISTVISYVQLFSIEIKIQDKFQ